MDKNEISFYLSNNVGGITQGMPPQLMNMIKLGASGEGNIISDDMLKAVFEYGQGLLNGSIKIDQTPKKQ